MHEAVDVVFELDEGAKAGDLRDAALDDFADLEAAVDLAPRIGFELLHAEGDALVGLVDAENDGFDFLALLEHLGRMVDLAGPAEVGHVDHAVDAFFEFDEGAVGGEVAHRAGHLRAHRIAGVDVVPRIRLELTHAEADLALVLVDAKNDGLDDLADGEHIGRTGNALRPGELGDVDEAFDAFFHFHEGTVSDELGDLAADLVAHGVAAFDVFPRIVLKLLQAEGDTLLLAIHFENDDVHALADADHLRRMVEAAPGHVGDVKQTVHAVEVHEHAEVGDVLDHAGDLVARGDGIEELLALFGTLGLDDLAAGEHDVFALVVDLDDLELEHLADVFVEVLRRDDVDLAGGQEGFDAHVDGETAFDHALDLAFDESAIAEHGSDLVPVLFVGGLFL